MHTLTELVDSISKDAGQGVSRARIEEVASEVVAQFENATITAYVPIFVDRMIRARLRENMHRPVA